MNELLDNLPIIEETYHPTQLSQLDEMLGGGLHPGLYVLGAAPSIGKTSLTLQVADTIASTGQDVLIYSMIDPVENLIAKSVSRYLALETISQDGGISQSKSPQELLNTSRYSSYSQKEKTLLHSAFEQYEAMGQSIYIFQSARDTSIQGFLDTVNKFVKITGNHPVIFVDYLQAFTPYLPGVSDEQNMYKVIAELQKLSRSLNTPIWAVSSINRSDYHQEVSLTSFESFQAIESTVDVLIGMELMNIETDNFDYTEAMDETPRQLNLKLLKNRYGSLGNPINLQFHTHSSYFEEVR